MSATWKYIKRKLDDSSTIRRTVYPFNVPQKAKPPYISYFLQDLEPVFTMDKTTTQKLEVWAVLTTDIDIKDAIENADAVVTLFNHGAGSSEGVTVKQSLWQSRSIPLVESDLQGDKVYQVVDTFEFRV